MGRPAARFAIRLLALLLVAGGCDCSSDAPVASLQIVAPNDGATLTMADDRDEDATGLQIRVDITSAGLSPGEEVGIFLEASGSEGELPELVTRVDEDGVASAIVTLNEGEHSLQARARAMGVASQEVRVHVLEGCPAVSFVSPSVPLGGHVSLGPNDDVDGLRCGEELAIDVIIATSAPDGRLARLVVNGTPRAIAEVEGNLARFSRVPMENRGETPNSLSVMVEGDSGAECETPFPAELLVDCEGATCRIASPEGDGFLSAADDASEVPGFQSDFIVETDESALGHPVRLVIDIDESESLQTLPAEFGDGARALFTRVGLDEGVRRVQAVCTDEAGNVTRSAPTEWIVDTEPCDVTIEAPDSNRLFVDSDDLDAETPGIQARVAARAFGDACTTARIAPCNEIEAAEEMAIEGGLATATLTLSSEERQELCVEVDDAAGNTTQEKRRVRVRTTAPTLVVRVPETGVRVSRAGGAFDGETYVADLDPTTSTCDVAFTVLCSEINEPVELLRDDTLVASAECELTATGYDLRGHAIFPSVALGASGTLSFHARQSSDRLTGTSSPVTIVADCEPPELAILEPMCGATLRPAVDDEDTSTPELEHDVRVRSASTPRLPVTLRIYPEGGSPTAALYTATTSIDEAFGQRFSGAGFGSSGRLTIEGEASDAHGNRGVTPPCVVTVRDLPTLVLTSPVSGNTLTGADDCNPAAGMHVRVAGTTDAPDGSVVAITVGGAARPSTSIAGGAFDTCVAVPEGTGVDLHVTITDARGAAAASLELTVDGTPPPDAISDLRATSIEDRRGGIARLEWTAVADAGGGVLTSYELRCARTPIESEVAWESATPVVLRAAPASAGTPQGASVAGFATGTTRFCALRGVDPGGALTPLAIAAAITVPFVEEPPFGGDGGFGIAAAALDLDDDGTLDLAIGTDVGTLHVYYGRNGAVPSEPDATIRDGSGGLFGHSVAAIGDIDSDGRDDLLVGQPFAGGGAAYVLFGRERGVAWPSEISHAPCNADVCITSGTTSAELGLTVAPAGDFDGDGTPDLAITAGGDDRVHVVLGDATWTHGTALAIPGTTSNAPRGFSFAPPAATSGLGWGERSVASLGDLDGDALDDLVVAASGRPSVSSALVLIPGRIRPAPGLEVVALGALNLVDTGAPPIFGTTVATSDVDGDGQRDLLTYRDFLLGGDSVQTYLGAASGFSVSRTVSIVPGGLPEAGFGAFLASSIHPALGTIGDLDDDGLPEMLVGAHGTAHLFYGRARASGDLIQGDHSDATFVVGSGGNLAVTFVGDLDGDLHADALVCDPTASSRCTFVH